MTEEEGVWQDSCAVPSALRYNRRAKGRVYGTVRSFALVFVTAAGVAGVAGCGSSQSSGMSVANVAGVAEISNATLQHWMPIEAHIIYKEKPTQAPPAGVMPDPPEFDACISFLGKYLTPSTTNAVEGHPELKRACQKYYSELRAITLNTLIGWYWIVGQGRALRVKVTPQEAKERLATVNKRLFATSADFANYLSWTDETVADMMFRSEVQLFEARIRAKSLAEAEAASKITDAKQRQEALNKLSENLEPAKRWVSRTTCQPGFVVSSCAEYKGTLSPGLPD